MKFKEDVEEMLEVQEDFTNLIYNQYLFCTKDEEAFEQLVKKFKDEKNEMSFEEFLEESESLSDCREMEKIEFTGYSLHPMGFLVMHYVINDRFESTTNLSTKSAETGKYEYMDMKDSSNGVNLKPKIEPTNKVFPNDSITFYEGGVNLDF